MRSFRLFPIVLALAAIPVIPLAAGARTAQQDPAIVYMYRDRYEQQLRERHREELAKLEIFATVKRQYVADPCGLGCGDHYGLQTRAIPGTPLVGVVYQANREDGVLTLRLRLYNDGSEPARLTIDPTSAYEAFFVRVGGEKLHILKGEDGELEAKESLEVDLEPGHMESWWANFRAPSLDSKAFDLEIPPIDPFRDVPLTDD